MIKESGPSMDDKLKNQLQKDGVLPRGMWDETTDPTTTNLYVGNLALQVGCALQKQPQLS